MIIFIPKDAEGMPKAKDLSMDEEMVVYVSEHPVRWCLFTKNKNLKKSHLYFKGSSFLFLDSVSIIFLFRLIRLE